MVPSIARVRAREALRGGQEGTTMKKRNGLAAAKECDNGSSDDTSSAQRTWYY